MYLILYTKPLPLLGRPQGMTLLGRPQGMTLCLHDRVSVCVSVCLSVRQHFGIHFFIGLYLFNTATDQVHFCHACTLEPGLYSPNVFGDCLALINYANLCKICQSVNILVYTFFIGLYLFNTATDRVYFLACMYHLGPGLYSPNVFGDAALINYPNLCKFSQNHIKCSYFLISRQILFKFGIQIYYNCISHYFHVQLFSRFWTRCGNSRVVNS